jgi:hypothetical protein
VRKDTTSADRALSKARILYSEKKYPQVISLLSPQIFLYRTNKDFYEMLGISCLYMNDFGGAHTYLSRAVDLDPMMDQSKLGLAVVYLRRGKIAEALQQWLDVKQINQNSKEADIGLEFVRDEELNQGESVDINDSLKKKLYPKPPRNYGKLFRYGIAILVTLIILWLMIFMAPRFFDRPVSTREGAELLFISPNISRLSVSTDHAIMLTASQIDDLLSQAARYFDDFADNQVRRIINQLLISNASEDIKIQMTMLLNSLRTPGFTDLFWYPQIQEVIKAPQEFRNVFVRWKGRVSNLRMNPTNITFEFLVGYETGQVLDAIVPVELFFPTTINSGDNLEIIGQLLVNSRGDFRIQGTSIRLIR